MDYQCVIVYTVITILPPPPSHKKRPSGTGRSCFDSFVTDEDDEDIGCFSWIKRWIKRIKEFTLPHSHSPPHPPPPPSHPPSLMRCIKERE
ncbi:hypothetical protein M8J77_008052 [Diaphorina citri]|nr:hypothetical protein M8J77_008052 [Diaphorina citri]